MHRLVLFSVLVIFLCSCTNQENPEKTDCIKKYKFCLQKLDDIVVYDNDDHAGFTGMIDYHGCLYLAFREGPNHLPSSQEEYGGIRIMRQDKGKWITDAFFRNVNWDLRDPYFLIVNGKLRVYIGYNQNLPTGWEHIATVYSELNNNNWGELTTINHDVPHNIWLWKARCYNGAYYGVGYMENKKPVFLTSTDGANWSSLAEFEISGVPTEADCCFINDTCHIVIRRDVPKGTYAYLGVAAPPYHSFEWKESKIRVDCPDLCYLEESDQIYLAGREWVYYDNREDEYETIDSVNCSLYELDRNGVANRIDVLVSVKKIDRIPDNGYPSIVVKEDTMYVSYYNGFSKSQVRLARYHMIKKSLEQ